jgi:hypothetical protein
MTIVLGMNPLCVKMLGLVLEYCNFPLVVQKLMVVSNCVCMRKDRPTKRQERVYFEPPSPYKETTHTSNCPTQQSTSYPDLTQLKLAINATL